MKKTLKKNTVKTLAYWTATILGPTSFVIGGILGLRQSPDVVNNIHHLGYPLYFATLLSTWKLLGAIAITAPGLPRLKEWAYAGFVFDLTGASISHAAVGDTTTEILVPMLFLGFVAASWALRPASRRIDGKAQASGSLAIGRPRSAEKRTSCRPSSRRPRLRAPTTRCPARKPGRTSRRRCPCRAHDRADQSCTSSTVRIQSSRAGVTAHHLWE